MSSRSSKSSPSRSRSTNVGSPTQARTLRGHSETEASEGEGGIPPSSIGHMRANLRSLIDTMGNENETTSGTSSGELCRRCGRQTSSDSLESCECCVTVQPAVHGACASRAVNARSDTSACYASRIRRPTRYVPRSSSSDECPCDATCPGKKNTREKIQSFLSKVVGIRENITSQNELYKFRTKHYPNCKLPQTLIFDLVDGIPKQPEVEKPKNHVVTDHVADYNNKVDVYYFDHGNSGYYRTTDQPPPLMADFFIEQTDLYATRFWAEIFGTLHIGVAFVTSFLLQLFRFVFYTILRPLTVGLVQIASDYFLKPLLSMTFNGIVQPVMILAYNIATSFRDLCEPIAQGVGFFLREIANVFRSVRLVEVNGKKTPDLTNV